MDIVERLWSARNPISPWNDIEIVAAASHPGAVNTLAPIVDQLVKEHRPGVTLYTAGKVNERLVPEFPFSRQPDAMTHYDNITLPESTGQAVLAIMSASAPPDIDACELPLASQLAGRLDEGKRALVTLVEDISGTLRSVMPRLKQQGISGDRVARMFLATDSSSRAYPEDEFGVPRERMHVTGSATFDAIKTEDTDAINLEVRRELEIPLDTLVIGYFGMPSQEPYFEGLEFRATKGVSRVIEELVSNHKEHNYAFLYRRHPRETKPEELRQLLSKPQFNLTVIPHEESESIPTRKIAAATNLSISLASTVLTEMALRGAREQNPKTGSMPLYLLNADAISLLGYPDYKYEIPVPVQLGAAGVAWNNDQLLPKIEELLFKSGSRRQIARKQATVLKKEFAFGDLTKSAASLTVLELEKLISAS